MGWMTEVVLAGVLSTQSATCGENLHRHAHGTPGTELVAKIEESSVRTDRTFLRLVHAIIMQESTYRADAVSPAGATGLMQIMPIAEREAREVCQITGEGSLTDIHYNVRVGTCFLSHLLDMYRGRVDLALAHYNGGGRQATRLAKGQELARETANYLVYVRYWSERCEAPPSTYYIEGEIPL